MKKLQKVQKPSNSKKFRIFLILAHLFGIFLTTTGIVIGLIYNRIIFDDQNIIIFEQSIDIATYLLIVVGMIILCSLLVYWTIYLILKKEIQAQKQANEFMSENWQKYAHIINAEKINPFKLTKKESRK